MEENNGEFPKEKPVEKKPRASKPIKSVKKTEISRSQTKKNAKASQRTSSWRKAQALKGNKQLNLLAADGIRQKLKTINKEYKKGVPFDQILLDLLLKTEKFAEMASQKEMICKLAEMFRGGAVVADSVYHFFEQTVLSEVPENKRKLLKLFAEKCKAGAPLDEFFYEMFELTTSREVLYHFAELERLATKRHELELGIKVARLVGWKRTLVMHVIRD